MYCILIYHVFYDSLVIPSTKATVKPRNDVFQMIHYHNYRIRLQYHANNLKYVNQMDPWFIPAEVFGFFFLFFCSLFFYKEEEFEDTKGVIRIRKSKKDRQHNGQKKSDKRTSNDLQNTTHKTKDQVTRTPLKTGNELWCSRRVSSSCSTSGTHRVTLN